MSFIKKVSNSDAGDADHVGGNDWDALDDYFNDVNEDSSRTAKINTKTRIRDQKLQTLNPAGTFTTTYINPAATATSTAFLSRNAYDYTMAKVGSTYYVLDKDNIVFTSGTNLQTVFQAAIDQAESLGGADIYVPSVTDGSQYWTLPGGFTGFQVGNDDYPAIFTSNVNIICARNALWRIPAGFTGAFFTFGDNTRQNSWSGGRILQTSPSHPTGWAAFKFRANTQGACTHNVLRDVYITSADPGIYFLNDGYDGFCDGNHIMNIDIRSPSKGIVFEQTVAYLIHGNGFNRNWFEHIVIWCNQLATTTDGITGIKGIQNVFNNCIVWDMNIASGAVTSSIDAASTYTIIHGGIMRYGNYTDAGLYTVANDDMYLPAGGVNQGFFIGKPRTNTMYEDIKTMSAPSSPPTGYIRAYPKAIDANNDGWFIKRNLNGAVVEVQIG